MALFWAVYQQYRDLPLNSSSSNHQRFSFFFFNPSLPLSSLTFSLSPADEWDKSKAKLTTTNLLNSLSLSESSLPSLLSSFKEEQGRRKGEKEEEGEGGERLDFEEVEEFCLFFMKNFEKYEKEEVS